MYTYTVWLLINMGSWGSGTPTLVLEQFRTEDDCLAVVKQIPERVRLTCVKAVKVILK